MSESLSVSYEVFFTYVSKTLFSHETRLYAFYGCLAGLQGFLLCPPLSFSVFSSFPVRVYPMISSDISPTDIRSIFLGYVNILPPSPESFQRGFLGSWEGLPSYLYLQGYFGGTVRVLLLFRGFSEDFRGSGAAKQSVSCPSPPYTVLLYKLVYHKRVYIILATHCTEVGSLSGMDGCLGKFPYHY